MKILVTGGKGQLGSSLKRLSGSFPELNFFFTDIEDFDITNLVEVKNILHRTEFTHLINCAAYTAVDKAETEPEKARLINVTAVKNLAEISQKHNIKLIHISTDYVFDGNQSRPYTESDIANPKNTYGITKFEGEKAALENCGQSIVIRTSWLYSEYGSNFVKTILKLKEDRTQIKVVCDQIGTPTYAGDLAEAILNIIAGKKSFLKPEIYHYSNEGVASWYDFADEIITLTSSKCEILPITTEQYPLPAYRPFYSLLLKTKIKYDFGLSIPHWKKSLKKCLTNMSAQAY
jgi:dTDP-4-dehydrorhamnose reductase